MRNTFFFLQYPIVVLSSIYYSYLHKQAVFFCHAIHCYTTSHLTFQQCSPKPSLPLPLWHLLSQPRLSQAATLSQPVSFTMSYTTINGKYLHLHSMSCWSCFRKGYSPLWLHKGCLPSFCRRRRHNNFTQRQRCCLYYCRSQPGSYSCHRQVHHVWSCRYRGAGLYWCWYCYQRCATVWLSRWGMLHHTLVLKTTC